MSHTVFVKGRARFRRGVGKECGETLDRDTGSSSKVGWGEVNRKKGSDSDALMY